MRQQTAPSAADRAITLSPQEKSFHFTVAGEECRLAVKSRLADSSEDLLVFIHGLGCSSETFQSAWTHPSLKGISLLAFDLFGFGASEKPSDFSYALEEQATVCHQLISQFASRRVHLVAHSMGGAIALILTRSFKPASLINVEGNLIAEDCGSVSRGVNDMSESSFVSTGFDALKQRLSNDPFDLARADAIAFHRSAGSLVNWSDSGKLIEYFAELDAPKYYVYGERNSGIPVLQKLAGLIPTHEIADSAHFPMVENSAAFYRRIAELCTTTV